MCFVLYLQGERRCRDNRMKWERAREDAEKWERKYRGWEWTSEKGCWKKKGEKMKDDEGEERRGVEG